MKKSILIFGAFDRFNYGDLLFPLIIVEKLKEVASGTEYNFRFYGIVKSDLSDFGGVPTRDIEEFNKDCNSIDNAVVIIAGGEVLNAKWSVLLSYLVKRLTKPLFIYKKIFRGKFTNILDTLIQWYYKSPSKMPFIILKNDFKHIDKIIYNAVGGPREKEQLLNKIHLYEKLIESDYIAVRDRSLYDLFKKISSEIKLTPDSAVLMSRIFPKKYLTNKININKKDFQNNYLFFQINISSGFKNITQISEQLTSIHRRHHLEIVLCPIGTALGHEDHVPLQSIHESLKFPNILIETPSIWDIMYLISNSNLYIGTSLHGTITAMSFEKPYIGIGGINFKLDAYLNSWGVDGLNGCVSIHNIAERANIALSVSTKDLTENIRKQIELSDNSFIDIHQAIIR